MRAWRLGPWRQLSRCRSSRETPASGKPQGPEGLTICARAQSNSCFVDSPGLGKRHWGACGFAHCFLSLTGNAIHPIKSL